MENYNVKWLALDRILLNPFSGLKQRKIQWKWRIKKRKKKEKTNEMSKTSVVHFILTTNSPQIWMARPTTSGSHLQVFSPQTQQNH